MSAQGEMSQWWHFATKSPEGGAGEVVSSNRWYYWPPGTAGAGQGEVGMLEELENHPFCGSRMLQKHDRHTEPKAFSPAIFLQRPLLAKLNMRLQAMENHLKGPVPFSQNRSGSLEAVGNRNSINSSFQGILPGLPLTPFPPCRSLPVPQPESGFETVSRKSGISVTSGIILQWSPV